MSTSDPALLDTNILVYGHQALSSFHEASRAILDKGLAGEIPLCICPQVLLEFFAVITNSRRVTKPVSSKKAISEMEKYLEAGGFRMLYPTEETLQITLDLAEKYAVNGAEIFDVHLVATMLSNEVTQLYTYNLDHFKKFPRIVALTP
jgi:toxin-antitoxin system PIN domain toxin